MVMSFRNKITWTASPVTDPRHEAIVGIDNFQNPWFLRKGLEKSRAVGKVADLGTGWLIADSLLMTNWHVLRRADWATGKKVFFNFEQNEDGSLSQFVPFELAPATFFHSDEHLDYAVVAVNGTPGKDFGIVDILRPGILNTDTRVNIIQHPGAGMKKIAIRDNSLKHFDDTVLQYWTDTEHGSSGSPLFNDRWEIIGLHFRYDSAIDPNKTSVIYNEGHTITAISTDLLSKFPSLLT